MKDLQSIVEYTDFNNCIFRDGFVFTSICEPANVLDAIVVRHPMQSNCWSPKKSFSCRSLEEHIEYINLHRLEKAMIIAEDISFVIKCPTLKYLEIVPADTSFPDFDYSPLYKMPQILFLSCKTSYGGSSTNFHTSIDYSNIRGIKKLQIEGSGHYCYNSLYDLEELAVYADNTNLNLQDIGNNNSLKRLWIAQSRIQSLSGVEKLKDLQELCIENCKAFHDITDLSCVSSSLRSFSVRNCPAIKDFTILSSLSNLEFLHLHGRNVLPDLSFLQHMGNLKVFTFSMSVRSCNLFPCLQIPYVDLSKGKREYNLKNKDLPKKLPNTPFEIR